jgi:hypothetical protein
MARINLKDLDLYVKDGLSGTAAANKKTNNSQTLTITAGSGGTFTMQFSTATTGPLTWNVTPAQLQAALEGLETIGEGNMSVTGTAGVSYVCEFIGTLAQAHQADMVCDDAALTGHGAGTTGVCAETVAGGVGTAPVATDGSLAVTTVVLNTSGDDQLTTAIPVGARFTIAGEAAATTVHVVQSRTPATFPAAAATTAIVFLPILGAATTTYATGAVLTFLPQEVEIHVGDGDMKWTEADQYKYWLERGSLDTVAKGDDVPMEVSMNFTFDQVKSGTGETVTPIEAIKGIGQAIEWRSTSSDACEPYACDIEVEDTRSCSSEHARTYTFPDFRSEKRDYDVKTAAVAVSGKCNAVEPVITVAT